MSFAIPTVGREIDQADPRRRAWGVFGILFALMVVDYVDRQVVVSMFPHLKRHWLLSDAQLGALVSIISATVALGTVPLSILADRWSRVKSIFLMAVVWSVATIACAFAGTYLQLIVARAAVGLGEAAYGSAGAALLATVFPERMRSTVLGAFLAAGLVGSVFGVMAGGVIAERWGWQAGFGAVGIPGLVLAFVFLMLVRDYRTVPIAAPAGRDDRLRARDVAAMLTRPRTVLVTCLAAGLQLVMVSTVYAWLPSFLNRFYGLAPDRAGLKTGVVVLLSGLGAVAWSVLADRWSVRMPRARIYVCSATAAATAVLMALAFGAMSPGPAQFWMIVAGATAMTGTIGPAAAIVIDVVHPGVRATAAAMLSLTQNLFGLAAGPLLGGLISDAYGLPTALAVTPVFCLLSAVTFLFAARTYEGDLARARAGAA
ncbi:MAG TPA: MFS transporter [Usitatibacter sp.]|jgi:predicted MFS family arabinose efflux permease|nr:MFS transporter [Usitatibacter sp.]